MDERGPETYVIPPNITDNGNVLNGMIKKKNLFESIAVFVAGFLIWSLIKPFIVSGMVKAILLIPTVFLTMLTLVGFGESSLIEYILEATNFKKKKRVVIFKIPRREPVYEKKLTLSKKTRKKV